LIKAGGRVREFNFRRPTGSTGEIFYVDVTDEKGERYHFSLVREGEHWRLPEAKLPPWMMLIEKKLEEAIKESETR
jgi:hypothetical protein